MADPRFLDDGAPSSPAGVCSLLRASDYLADRGLCTAIYLGLRLDQPLLLEGEPGVGKTEVAKAVAMSLGRTLVRLQCYEGIDSSEALYEWDYPRQLLYLRSVSDGTRGDAVDDLFSERFLLERPLLTALKAGHRAVLLIDEIDRADDEFEAFLLELLSDFQITIPEIGTVAADRPPFVVLTSNRTRELHDALKRRCLYHWIDFPSLAQEVEIVRVRAPEVPAALAKLVARTVARMRALDLAKSPGVAETINWARALGALGIEAVGDEGWGATLGAVMKDRDDLLRARTALQDLLADETR